MVLLHRNIVIDGNEQDQYLNDKSIRANINTDFRIEFLLINTQTGFI